VMAFLKPQIESSIWLDPQCCQDVRKWAIFERPIEPLTMTREESELKQLAYERDRALWRKAHPARETKA